jgi:hypothetical protein
MGIENLAFAMLAMIVIVLLIDDYARHTQRDRDE